VASIGDTGERKSGKRQIQSKMLSEMIAVDKDQALRTIKTWDKFVKTASAHKHLTHFATLDEYLHIKVIDIGQMYISYCYFFYYRTLLMYTGFG
jgi:hypothetical protein